jgi:hypothetical protein
MNAYQHILNIVKTTGFIRKMKFSTGHTVYEVIEKINDSGSMTIFCEMNHFDAIKLAKEANVKIREEPNIFSATNFIPRNTRKGHITQTICY